jgi:hypothetical protein
VMSYAVDFDTLSTAGPESSPVAGALAGLRPNEARYFRNKYDHVFTVEPASRAHGDDRLGAADPQGRARFKFARPKSLPEPFVGPPSPSGTRADRVRPAVNWSETPETTSAAIMTGAAASQSALRPRDVSRARLSASRPEIVARP